MVVFSTSYRKEIMPDLTLKSESTKGQVCTVVDVKKANVICIHHSNNKAANASYLLNWKLDFSGISQEDILKMAAENLKIIIRRGFTDATKPKFSDWDHVTFDAADFIVKRVSKKDKATAALGAMSNEEILAYLEGRSDS